MEYPVDFANQYIQHENTGLPNQYQADRPVAAKPPRLNCYGGGPGYDPTVSLTLQSPLRTDKANVFLRVRNTAEAGQACPMEDPKTPRTSQKCQKVLKMTSQRSQRYVTTDCCCLEMSLHADTQQQKKGRPPGVKNKKPNEDGGSQIPTYPIYHTAPVMPPRPTSTMFHTAPVMPPAPTSTMYHTSSVMPPLATPMAQPTSLPVGHPQTTDVSEEQWGEELLEPYYEGNTPLPDAYIYNNGNYGNSSSNNPYSYPNQPPVNLTGYEPYDTLAPTISQGYNAPNAYIHNNGNYGNSSSSNNSYSYPAQPPVNLTGYQPYDTPPPTISQGYDAPSSSINFDEILYDDTPAPTTSQGYNPPSSSIDTDNILDERLRTISSLNQNATAAAQDNSPSPFNPSAREDDYLFYADPEPLQTEFFLNSNATAAAQDNSPSPFNPEARDDDYLTYPDPEQFSFFDNDGFWTMT